MKKNSAQAQPPAARTRPPKGFVSIEQVLELVPVSRVTLWRMENEGRFPARVEWAQRRVVFRRAEVDRWLADPAAFRGKARVPSAPQASAPAA